MASLFFDLDAVASDCIVLALSILLELFDVNDDSFLDEMLRSETANLF